MTKPIDFIVKEGQQHFHPEGKQYALLGVYSGEPYLSNESSNENLSIGIVWYAYLIDEIIINETLWSEQLRPTVSLGSMIRPMRRKQKLQP